MINSSKLLADMQDKGIVLCSKWPRVDFMGITTSTIQIKYNQGKESPKQLTDDEVNQIKLIAIEKLAYYVAEVKSAMNIKKPITLMLHENLLTVFNSISLNLKDHKLSMNLTMGFALEGAAKYVIGHELGHITPRIYALKVISDIVGFTGDLCALIVPGLGKILGKGLKNISYKLSHQVEFMCDDIGIKYGTIEGLIALNEVDEAVQKTLSDLIENELADIIRDYKLASPATEEAHTHPSNEARLARAKLKASFKEREDAKKRGEDSVQIRL